MAKEVRLVGDRGEQLGIMPVAQAREAARKANLDLVEVAPTSVPPVCRLLDYGKFKYEQQKKEQQAKKAQKLTTLREIRMRPKIGVHDFDAKARTARKLLEEGAKIKVTLMFRGREITHPELGWKLLQRMAETLADLAGVEQQAVMEGRRMHIVLAPITAKVKEKAEAKAAQKAEEKAPAKAAAAAKTTTKAAAKTTTKAGAAKPAAKAETNVATKEPEHAETQNA
jgi:translation initiation factor IF-3